MSKLENAKVRYKDYLRIREQEWGYFYTVEEYARKAMSEENTATFFTGSSGADVYDYISVIQE